MSASATVRVLGSKAFEYLVLVPGMFALMLSLGLLLVASSPLFLVVWLIWRAFCFLHIRLCVEKRLFWRTPLERALRLHDASGLKGLVRRGVDLRMGGPDSSVFAYRLLDVGLRRDEFDVRPPPQKYIDMLSSVGWSKLSEVGACEHVLRLAMSNRMHEVCRWCLNLAKPDDFSDEVSLEMLQYAFDYDCNFADELLNNGFPLPSPKMFISPTASGAMKSAIIEKHKLLRRSSVRSGIRKVSAVI